LIRCERETLSPYACLSVNTHGRDFPITECSLRTEFQRDRDRIIHSKSFRRLMHKTQVFLSPEEDHYRTRLTHTLEVTQIARTIARALRLNEDLCEAVGLGHDLGHTPFGHAGERVLQKCYSRDFTHYRQSLRIVEKLESLNLTYEVRNGILCHTNAEADTLEGRIVRLADRIAYINHDIDDACRAGIMTICDIPYNIRNKMGDTHGERINYMVTSIINASNDKPYIIAEESARELGDELHEFLFEKVYKNPIAKGQEGKAEDLLEQLYVYYIKNPDELPDDCRKIVDEEGVARAVCDHIAGMTDRYAINTYKKIFIPEVWNNR
jgi:dGTPase